jgi:hypothetical protein
MGFLGGSVVVTSAAGVAPVAKAAKKIAAINGRLISSPLFSLRASKPTSR